MVMVRQRLASKPLEAGDGAEPLVEERAMRGTVRVTMPKARALPRGKGSA